MKNGTVWVVICIMVVLGLAACGGGGSSDPAPSTYSLSGTVTASGSGLAGVTMTLIGSSSATITTDASGNFSFTSLANGNYTVTPSMAGYTFNPTNSTQTVNNANITSVTFVASASTSTMGTVQGTITYSGTDTPSATKLLAVVIYPFDNTNMQGPPNGSTIQSSGSSTSPFSYSFTVPPGDYHLIAMFDVNGDSNFNSGNIDPYLIYTPNNSAGTGTFGASAAKFTVIAGQSFTADISFGDTYKK